MADLPAFPRETLAAAFNNNPRMISAFEQLINLLVEFVNAAEGAAGGVISITQADFVLTSGSDALANGRTIAGGRGISVALGANTVTVSHPIAVTGGMATFILTADTNLILPSSGTVARTADIPAYIAMIGAGASYANDAAAAAGGVPVGGGYRNGSVFQIRVS